jgi:glycosyltransferase involved in cell wall biosynthesis
MKIAYLSTFYPFRGGIAQFNASLYREFEKEHDINAFTFKRQYPKILFPGTSQMVGENDNADKIPAIQLLDTINPITYFSTPAQINKYKPDLLIMKYWMPFFAPSLGMSAHYIKKRKTKIISILDNVIPHEKRLGDIALTNFFLRQNHGFIVMSEAVKNDLLSLKHDAKFTLQPHPLYDHFGSKIDKNIAREKLEIPLNKKVLLFFGFIRDYKGLDLLINTMKNLNEDYILVIAGEVYGDFSKYEKMIDETGVRQKVKLFVRYINDDEVPLFFSAADVCVQPYKSATQSGIVGISYHFDLPMIATDVGGLKEMIEPYQTGIVIKKPEIKLIETAIKSYFDNNLAEKYRNNIAAYKEVCSWKNLSKAIIDLYKDMI